MSVLIGTRRRIFLIVAAFMAVIGVVLVGQGGQGVAYAEGNDLWEDGIACFGSGQHRDVGMVNNVEQRGKESFGNNEQFTLDRDDLFALLGDKAGLVRQDDDKLSYFPEGFPQTVDWLYGMYPEDFHFWRNPGGVLSSIGGQSLPSLDDKVYDFFLWSAMPYRSPWQEVCGAGSDPLCYLHESDNREIKSGIPPDNHDSGTKFWDNIGHYLEMRAVARYRPDFVDRFAAGWYDPRNPEGGLRINPEAVSADELARLRDLDEATRRGVVEGHRLITGTNEVPYVLVNGTFGTECTGGNNVCSVNSEFNSTVETATVQDVKVDHSNNEQHKGDVDDELPVGVGEDRAGRGCRLRRVGAGRHRRKSDFRYSEA